MSDKDPFKDLTFSGAPSEYRLFRRKILLSVASLEEKHVYLAGPRILNRLTGEAWRATEHLSIGELRSEKGWLSVLRALDDHYRYLPETELNECVDEFLFHLKRKSHEGATAFVSRFKSVLSRLETLVAAEKTLQRGPSKRRRSKDRPANSDRGISSSSFPSEESEDGPRLTKDRVDAAAAASDPAAGAKPSAEPTAASKGPQTVGSFVDSPKRKPPSGGGGSQKSRGTQRADDERANRKMLESLEKLEVGHLKVRPIFPEVILGHLFMRKYGLNREQRSQIIRSTGGSCKFKDIEKVIRASDYEEKIPDSSGKGNQHRPSRSGNVIAAEEASSLSEPTYSDDEVNEAAEGDSQEDEDDEDLEEAYEVQRKAKQDAKKAFRSYKESRRKVKEIRKDRQPYMPVVAIPPSSSAMPADAMPIQPTFKYDRKNEKKNSGNRAKGGRKGRREDVSLVQGSLVTEFSYMLTAEAPTTEDHDIFAVTVPAGLAVIDTGCTTSVIGECTARRYQEHFRQRGLPEPVSVTLPPVQLKGFNGVRTTTDRGLRWTVKLGKLWGQVTTYTVEGEAPFLLSRRVLEGMQASIDLGRCTLTSVKHGIHDEPLAQASNGHLLLPLLPPEDFQELMQVQDSAEEQESDSVEPEPGAKPTAVRIEIPPARAQPAATERDAPEEVASHKASLDSRRHFQTIMKHTRYTQVDVGSYRYQLRKVFGQDVDFALCAYRPRYERVPKQAASHCLSMSVAHLKPGGELEISPWTIRPPAARRASFDRPGACIFAFRYASSSGEASPEEVSVSQLPVDQHSEGCKASPAAVEPSLAAATCHTDVQADVSTSRCDCCSALGELDENPNHGAEEGIGPPELEAMYEEIDWVALEHLPVPAKSRSKIACQVEAVRRVPFQLALASLEENPRQVEAELESWLGPQAPKLRQTIGLIEVFAESGQLSQQCERIRGLASLRLGPRHGQDFSKARDRRLLLLLLGRVRAKDVWFSLPCDSWSGWSRHSLALGGGAARTALARRRKERPFLRLFEQAWALQTMLGGHAHIENPVGSLVWNELSLGPVYEVDFDMCALGLVDKKTHVPLRRRSRIVTSEPRVVSAFKSCQCPGHAQHAHNAPSASVSCSEACTRAMCKRLASVFMSRDKSVKPIHDIFLQTDDEADSERESDPEGEPEEPRIQQANRRSYAAMIQKLHVNTGHASVPQMLRLAQRAKAPPGLISEIRKFKCPVCEELQVPPSHKVAALRHTETPNHIVGLDVVQVELKRDGPNGPEEIKHNASKGWVIWGADIKTAFLSGDASNRQLFFRPPEEVREFMHLSDDDVLRLEKAAYGLAEAPRAWFLRLTRELLAVGLVVSQLDPCVFCLRDNKTAELLGICGVHVDDLLGGGTSAMDKCLERLKLKLPFGDFRRKTVKYTGAEIRQHADGTIEVTQEAYIDKLEEVCTKPFGKSSDLLEEPTLMRACCGQLAWVANHSRPDQAFLASYLQGVQDLAQVSHLELYNKAVREMKTRRVCLRFPPVPLDRWRLLAVTDAGWGVRANGESQGGLLLCLCDKNVLEQKPGATWPIEWSSKKLRRVVRSSTAAETLAAQNGLDAIEFAQAFLQEVIQGMSPRQFQQWTPEQPSGLVIDSKSLYDALTRSACSSALAMEKRLAIDYAIARACLQERHVLPFWTNNLQMISDCLTKLRGNKEILYRLRDTCSYHVRPSKESGRKETARKKGSS